MSAQKPNSQDHPVAAFSRRRRIFLPAYGVRSSLTCFHPLLGGVTSCLWRSLPSTWTRSSQSPCACRACRRFRRLAEGLFMEGADRLDLGRARPGRLLRRRDHVLDLGPPLELLVRGDRGPDVGEERLELGRLLLLGRLPERIGAF